MGRDSVLDGLRPTGPAKLGSQEEKWSLTDGWFYSLETCCIASCAHSASQLAGEAWRRPAAFLERDVEKQGVVLDCE